MAAEPDDGGPWLTVAEAARALGVTERAIRRRVQRGTLKTRRAVVGNRVLTTVRLPVPEPGRHAAAPAPDLRDALIARLEGEVAWLRAELERRRWRWPGLRELWRRLWEGEG